MKIITQVSYERVHGEGRRKSWSLTIGPKKSVDLFFEVTDGTLPEGLDAYEYLIALQRQRGFLPHGVHDIKSIDNDRFFRVTCDDDAVETATAFAQTLFE